MTRIAIGADHAGFELKTHVVELLAGQGHDVVDLGTDSTVAVDYPPICAAVGRAVRDGEVEVGIVLGGSGQGEQLSANKVRGVRAALCNDLYTARLARAHNDANVLAIGARVVAIRPRRRDRHVVPRHPVRRRAPRPARRPDHRPRSGLLTAAVEPTSDRSQGPSMPFPSDTDPDTEIEALLAAEFTRQTTGLQLIASENFTSPAVIRAMGSVLTNKYSEGYPGRRYYGGNAVIDDVEALAIERATSLFGADHANVQPHSGANANMCVYQALLEPGDTVLGLSLDHGGHLTHGSPVNASGMQYHFVAYKVTPGDERIDMDQVRDLALEHHPAMIVAGTTSYPRRLDPEPFRAIADEVGALFVFDAAHLAGLIVGGRAPRPRPPRRRRDVHDAQDAARPARRLPSVSRADHAKAIDKAVFPGWQGGPLEHVIAAKAVAFREAADPSFTELRPAGSCATPRRWPRRWRPRGSASCPGAPTTI